MEYTKLGNTGLDVSKFALGCMGFGDANRWHHPWTLSLDDARPIIKKALELGVNYFDTANIYAFGSSEEITGQCLRELANRDDYVIQTKVNQFMRPGPNGAGGSRRAILSELDHSLKRLCVDYIDIYLLQRWDNATPIEESLEAMNDAVRAGKVRYIGASTMKAWQFQKAVNICERHGWARPILMQNHYNLIYREEENEMIPYCQDAKIAIAPYSALAGGVLTHPWGKQPNDRSKTDVMLKKKYGGTEEIDKPIVVRVEEIAKKYSVQMATVALAWLMGKGCVPVAGADAQDQLATYVVATELKLTPEEMIYLEELYQHHGFVSTNRISNDPTGVYNYKNKE